MELFRSLYKKNLSLYTREIYASQIYLLPINKLSELCVRKLVDPRNIRYVLTYFLILFVSYREN